MTCTSTRICIVGGTISVTALVVAAVVFGSTGDGESCRVVASATARNESSTAGQQEVSSTWGVSAAVVAAIVNSVGLHLQKLAHLRIQDETMTALAHLGSRFWWIGFTCLIVAELFGAVAYGFAPGIVVSSMGSLTIVGTAILARVHLKESYTPVQFGGMTSVIVGTVLLSVSTPATSTLFDESALLSILSEPRSIVWFSIALVGIVTLSVLESRLSTRVRLFVIAFLAAGVSSFTVVAIRGLVSILSTVVGDCEQCGCVNTLRSPLTWVLVLVTLGTGFLSAGVIEQRGLRQYREQVWVPVHFVACALTFGFSSALVYGDTGALSASALVVLGYGVGLVIWGIVLISSQ